MFFLIFKAYVFDDNTMIKYIGTISIRGNENKKEEISSVLKKKFIKKMSFYDFKIWYEDFCEKEYEYDKNSNFIGFRIFFYKESNKIINGEIYPIYPWPMYFKKINKIKTIRNNKFFLLLKNPSLNSVEKRKIRHIWNRWKNK